MALNGRSELDLKEISSNAIDTIAYLKSLNSVWNEMAEMDFTILNSVKKDLVSAYELWSATESKDDHRIGELAVIIAALELRYSILSESNAEQDITKYLSTDSAQTAIKDLYLPPKLSSQIDEIAFYKAGTTSFIYTVKIRGTKYALKIVAPPFRYDDRVSAHTLEYKEKYQRLFNISEAPVVALECGEAFILMEFARGEELSTYCALRLGKSPSLVDKISLAERITRPLFRLLNDMERSGISHDDLNPKNIICEAISVDIVKLRVVDFGRNFLITDAVGSASRIQTVAEYIAPENRGNSEISAGILGDLYSVGRILLDILEPPTAIGVSPAERLKSLYQEAPSLGGLVENLVSPFAIFRSYGAVPGHQSSEVQAHLSTALQVASKLDALDGEMSLTNGKAFLPTFTGGVFKRIRQLRGIASLGVSSDHEGLENSRFLLIWAYIVAVGYLLTLFFFAALTIRDLKIPWLTLGPLSLSAANHILHLPPDGNGWRVNLPGRLVILSFVIVSTHYYMRIYAGLSFWKFPKGRFTDCWLRFSGISALPLAGFVFFYRPSDWAIPSALGTAVIGLSNYLVYRTCRSLLSAPTSKGQILATVESGRSDLEAFFSPAEFRGWSTLMFGYSLSLLSVGILLATHVAHDVWVYASLFIGLNLVKIDDSNSKAQAPKVRGFLARVVSLGGRSTERLGPI